MRTATLLRNATSRNVGAILNVAKRRGWTPDVIASFGNDVVKKALTRTPRVMSASAAQAGKRAVAPVATKYQLGSAWLGALALPTGTVPARLTVTRIGERGGHYATLDASGAKVESSFGTARLDQVQEGKAIWVHVPSVGPVKFLGQRRVQD